ncbi:MAG TPA: hypothetical protein VGV88_05200 [Candidatus Dormibacteraeota bacterium]|nr:hypothetical protein [Candidatus Dormibacteraeota bacterium]
MDIDQLPSPVRALLRRLAQVVASREPAIEAGIQALRAKHPHLTNDELAMALVRSTRRRVAATGAVSGAASIAPGLGTALALGTVTSQAFYALEQEVELVLAIAMVYGHELSGSEDRVLEALVVVGIASGALKLREDVLVAGGERLAVAAFRQMPGLIIGHASGRLVTRIVARVATSGFAKVAARVIPLAIGVTVGAGFDWLAVSALGRAAMRYYGPGGPGAKPLLLAPEDSPHVELGG